MLLKDEWLDQAIREVRRAGQVTATSADLADIISDQHDELWTASQDDDKVWAELDADIRAHFGGSADACDCDEYFIGDRDTMVKRMLDTEKLLVRALDLFGKSQFDAAVGGGGSHSGFAIEGALADLRDDIERAKRL